MKVDGSRHTVLDLQSQLHARTGVEPLEQQLVFGGRQLRRHGQGDRSQATLTLGDHGIQPGSTLQMLGRVPGGALLGKSMKGRAKDGAVAADNYDRAAAEAREKAYLLERAKLNAEMETERSNSHMNRLKIQNQWRKIMRIAKVETLQKDIEILSQNHERDVDRKDAIIQMLDRDLEEAEDQFQMSLRSNLENMDQLIDLQDTRLLALEQEFEKDLSTIETEFGAEKDAIVQHHGLEVQELGDIMNAVDQAESELEIEAKQEHEQSRAEIKNKNLDEINMLRIQLDGGIEDLEQKFENAHLNYLQTTDVRTSDFKYFTKKDQDLSKDIEIKIRKIERLQSSLNHWRTKYAQNVKECQARNLLMMEEKNKINSHYQQLKLRMNKFRGTQRQRLSQLTKNASKSKATLGEQIQLAERILTLAELARKLETEAEKVAPFYTSSANDEAADAKAVEAAAAAGDDAARVAMEKTKGPSTEPVPKAYQSVAFDEDGVQVRRWNQLDQFWKKYNKALLDKLAIERERSRLRSENESLKEVLKQYIDGVTVNEEVMNKEGNPLFVINGRVNLNRPMPVRKDAGEALSVVDGNHMFNTGKVNSGMMF